MILVVVDSWNIKVRIVKEEVMVNADNKIFSNYKLCTSMDDISGVYIACTMLSIYG